MGVPSALVAGVVFGWFAVWLTRLMRDGGSDAPPRPTTRPGREGRVVTPIPTDGFGVVHILIGGHTMRLNAKADRPMAPGTDVHVTTVLSPTAVMVAAVWRRTHLRTFEPYGELKDLSAHASDRGLVVLFVLLVLLVTSRYKVAGPNEAFIITGRKGKASHPDRCADHRPVGPEGRPGGGVFVVPFVQQLRNLDLSIAPHHRQIRGAVSKQGIKLNVDGIAIVKVGGDEDSIRARRTTLPSQQQDVEAFTTEVLAGALRSIVGGLTVEEIIRDRAAFAQRVADESENSLTGQGLVLDTFQIQDVTDDGTYLADLGRPEAARVQQAATIAEANARAGRRAGAGSPPSRRSPSPSARSRSSSRRSRPRPTRPGRDGRRRGPARRGRPPPGGPHRAGEGRRAPGRTHRAPARHRGPQARRRGALQGRAGGRGRAPRRDRRRRGSQGRHHRRRPGRGARRPALTGEAEKSVVRRWPRPRRIEGARSGEAEKARRVGRGRRHPRRG